MTDSLWPHGLQHIRLSCPSPTPRACSNSCPLSWWCHLTMLSSEIPFSCLQSFPASRSFQMTQFFTSGGQSIGFSFSVSPSNEYSELVSSSPTPQFKSISSSALSFLYGPILISIHVIFLIIAILIGLWWCFILVLICIFLMTSNIKHLVLCLMAIWVSALEKCLFWYSLH